MTLRIDRDLWEQFQKREHQGLIEDRTAVINQWLREKEASDNPLVIRPVTAYEVDE